MTTNGAEIERFSYRDALLKYASEQYATDAEYLWLSAPNYAVLRHADNRKWYAAVLDVPGARLGLDTDAVIDVLDVRCDPLLIGSLLTREGFLPGYHMNKNCWISVRMDGAVAFETLCQMLDLSFSLTRAGKKRG